MKVQYAIAIFVHFIIYLPLYYFLKRISIFTLGFLILMQLSGINFLILAFIKNDLSVASRTPIAILAPIVMLYLTRDRPMYIGRRKYAGLSSYLLFIDTDLKYVIGLFLLSLSINLYIEPINGLFNYINLTSVAAFLLSIPFCKRMNKLEEHDISIQND